MKPFIDIEQFMPFFNENQLVTKTTNTATLNVKHAEYTATIILLAEHDYQESYTIQFLLRFEHKYHKDGKMGFQREFSIEHHPATKSPHTTPHVQLHIYGPAREQKIGKLWITLPFETETEYTACIKGFIHALSSIITTCEPGLEQDLLHLDLVMNLTNERDLLMHKIAQSLITKGIEYEYPDGTREFLNPQNIKLILKKDTTLIPFFTKEEK